MSQNSGNYIQCPAKETKPTLVSVEQNLLWTDLNDFQSHFFDLLGVLAVMIDRRGIIRQFNRKAEDLTGYSKGKAVGQDWFTLMLPEQERTRAREQLLTGLHQGVGHMTLNMPVIARDDSRLPVCWSMSTLRDEKGDFFGFFGLGFVPSGPDAPCIEVRRQMENYSSTIGTMTHDLLNHSQVVMGYLEMAAEQASDKKELHSMLGNATRSMVKCGQIALNVQRLNNSCIK